MIKSLTILQYKDSERPSNRRVSKNWISVKFTDIVILSSYLLMNIPQNFHETYFFFFRISRINCRYIYITQTYYVSREQHVPVIVCIIKYSNTCTTGNVPRTYFSITLQVEFKARLIYLEQRSSCSVLLLKWVMMTYSQLEFARIRVALSVRVQALRIYFIIGVCTVRFVARSDSREAFKKCLL